MKTSRLAVPANPRAGSLRRAFAPVFRLGSPLRRVATAFLAPAVLSASAFAVNLSWNPNPEPDITGYQLSYGTSPGVRTEILDAGLNTSISVSGLAAGTTYYFAVTATNEAGLQSAPSDEISYQEPDGPVDPPASPGSEIPSTGWTVKYASSEETQEEDGRAVNAIDGDPDTYWMSRWSTNYQRPPHTLQIDLGTAQSIQGFRYLPRQDELDFGSVGQYEFYVSMDGLDWGSPVAKGVFTDTNSEKEVLFASKTGRYVQFRAITSLDGSILACVAELNLLQGGDIPPPENEAPVAVAQSIGALEDDTVPILLSAGDPDGDPLTYSIVSGPATGTLSGTAPELTYTPAADFNGSDSFTFEVDDGLAVSNTATVSITVAPVNDPPLASSKSVTTDEDVPVAIVLPASDKDSGSLSYIIVSGPSNGALSGTAPFLTYVPTAGFSGSDSFTFRASDGLVNSNTATVSITVNSINDAPMAESASFATLEDTPVSIHLSASDVEGDPLTYTVMSPPSGGTLSGTAPNLTYSPGADFNGSDSFTFRSNDGSLNSNTATVSITVTAVNDAPVAVSKSVTTDEDVPVAIVLAASDKDGDLLDYMIVEGPVHGSLSGTAPNLSYSPDAGFSGSDSFTFRANDGSANSSTATVFITVHAINDAPVAVSTSATTAEDTSVSIHLSATDVDGDSLTYTVIDPPLKGTLTGAAPDFTYVPDVDVSGADSFTFSANDGSVNSNTATVSITITPVNDRPVALAGSAATVVGEPVSVVLSAFDKDSPSLKFSIVSGPSKGSITGSPPNVSYLPNADSSGNDSFSFRANDGEADSDVATVSISVDAGVLPPPPPPNIRPVFAADPIVIPAVEDTALAGRLDASDPDEGGTLVFSKVSGPTWLTVSPSGALGGTPSNEDVGVNAFTVQAADSWGASASASLVVTVANTNDAPVFILNPITCPEGGEEVAYEGETIAGTAVDVDAGDSIAYAKVSGPEWLEISADGALSGMPPAGSSGLNLFTVRATDKAGAFGESILRISISSPDLPLPWELADLGSTGQPSRAAYASGSFTLTGSGNLAGSSDSGCYVWQSFSGDGSITARLISPGDGGSDSMAGVMIRDSLASNSRHCFIGMDGRGGFRWLRRSKTGRSTSSTTSGTGSPPDTWLRLVRTGRTVYAYTSTDGSKWSRVGSTSTRIGRNCYIGLVVASGTESLGSATFSEVEVSP